MANPTRLNKIGLAGQKNKLTSVDIPSNVSDSALSIKSFKLSVVASAAEQDTGIYVEPGISFIAYLKVTTPETTGAVKTVSVGLVGGAGDEFATDDSVAVAGRFLTTPSDPVISTGANLTYTLGSADFVELDCEVVIVLLEENA